MTIEQAGRALRRRETSSRELTAECLRRINAKNEELNTFLTVLPDAAISQAARMDEELAGGKDRGPLHGIPVALKDVFETAGVRTTCGSLLFADYVPQRDAAVAEKLAAAGCVLLGKTGMHELAYGVTSTNPHFGAVRNPRDPQRIPGGSSGGSGAAVATEMAFMAMGSDTGGSIRIPAAFCGTVGLKPTYGRVSRYGVMPLDFSLDHMGPLTRNSRDAALVLQVLAGRDARDETSSHRAVDQYLPVAPADVAGLRIGVPVNFYFDRVDAEVAAAARGAVGKLEAMGAKAVEVRVPDIAALNAIGRVILLVEAAACLRPYLRDRSKFGADVLSLLDQGSLLMGTEYVDAQRLRRLMQEEFRKLFTMIDCLVTPTTPTPAPLIGQTNIEIAGVEEDVRLASTRLVRGINVLGLPALSLPSGVTGSGLPMSVQLIGRAWEEGLLLRIGAALEGS